MKLPLFFISFLFLTAVFSGCKKVEGPGGSSSIVGKVSIVKLAPDMDTLDVYFAPKFDVYIIYGDNGVSFDDDVETSYDGSFKFDYLEKGNYTLFVYEDCASCSGSGKKALLTSVEITDKKSTVDVGTITVID